MWVEIIHNAQEELNDKVIIIYPKGVTAEIDEISGKALISQGLAKRANRFSCQRKILAYEEYDYA